ncbi:MAG: ABC transporter ATP-binding protein [Clostridia bacterium]|nr:ABC transporter ATP-binding protein [Clostridia bacterium]
MKLIAKYLRKFIGTMLLGLSIKIVGTLMDLVLPYILAHIVDDVVPKGDRNAIFLWGGFMIVCSVIALVGNIIANRMSAAVARDTTKAIRHDLFKKVMYLSSERLDKLTIPSLESRLTSDTFQIHRVVGMMQRIGVRAPILLIGGIFLTFFLDPVLTLVMVATLPFIGITVFLVSKKGIPMFTEVQKGVDSMTRVVRENAQGVRVVKALSKTDYERRHFDAANRDLVRLEKKASLTMALTNPMMTLFLNIGLAAVILIGAYRVRGGVSEPGVIIAFMSYFTIVTNAMLTITRIFTMMSRGTASANRIAEVLDLEPDLPVMNDLEASPCDGYLVFENVDFSYNKVKNNLTNIDFSLPRGGTLGIIGSTGSGKSTLIQLIMRYYDPDSGRIFIDGKDIRSYEPSELHSRIGIVRQNDFLYNDTIEENIRFGRDISTEEIIKAAKIAQADGFITEKEEGYSHMLTAKGTNVSGGQKQRILIARALASSPSLLILDDSSSALDYKTDATLRGAIRENYSETTTVIVAQRVSSIMNADLILVLEGGKIIASGKHEELMEGCEVYREISDSQLGGAILD